MNDKEYNMLINKDYNNEIHAFFSRLQDNYIKISKLTELLEDYIQLCEDQDKLIRKLMEKD